MGFFSRDKGEEVVLSVEGMSCMHCVGKVEKGLREMEGVFSAEVDLQKKEARVRFDPLKVNVDALKQGVADAGYRVV